MGIIGSIIIGFIVGLIARAIVPGKDAFGFLLTTLLGIGGALLGKFLGEMMGLYRPDQSAGFIMSVIGAVAILILYNIFNKRRELP
jgi:uncharacterized membrane protein YeaQ/YmgE (transglycosylase-associated protein family)